MSTRENLRAEVKFIPAASLVSFGTKLNIHIGSGRIEEEILQIHVCLFGFFLKGP